MVLVSSKTKCITKICCHCYEYEQIVRATCTVLGVGFSQGLFSLIYLNNNSVVLGLSFFCMYVLQVTAVELERVLTKGAYMLFYAR